MPTLYTRDGASAVFNTPEEVKAALDSGEWVLPEGGTVGYTTPLTGRTVRMTPEALELTPGGANFGVERGTAGFDEALEGSVHEAYSGAGDQVLGAAEGAASALSLGLSDLGLDALGADTKLRAEHTAGRTVGEVAAIVGTAVSPFGKGSLARLLAKTPAGAVSKFGAGGASALARVARTAGEGAAYGVGQAVSAIALSEPGMTAEQVISELGQGALLGAAMGGVAGGIGEGVRAVSAARAARPAAIDFTKGPGKEALNRLTTAHRTVGEAVDVAAGEHRTLLAEASKRLSGARQSVLASDVADLHSKLVAMRPVVAEGAVGKFAAQYKTADDLAAKALRTGKEVDQLTFLVYVEKAARKANAADIADHAAARLAENTAAAAKADELLAGMKVKFPKRADDVFELLPNEKLTPAAFERVLKKPPAEMVKRVMQLDDYYKGALEATKGSPVAHARVQEASRAYKEALDSLVPAEAQEKLSGMLTTVLGLETGVEVLVPEGPAKDFLRLAAAYKLVGGAVGHIRGGRSLGRTIANAIGKRAAAGLVSGAVRATPVVQRMGPAMGTAAVGAGASVGYEGYGMAQRLVNRMRGGTRAAVSSQAAVQAHIGQAIERVAAGKPKRARAMPALNVLLDKLVGDPGEAPTKTPQQKFKVIQDRLAKYAVAPDAALNSVYELLRPVQEVSEHLADLMESVLGVQFDYLLSKMPRDPGTMTMFGKSMWAPTDRELYEFGLHAMGVLQPLDVVDMIADGFVPPQAAQALAATNPEIFTKLQMGLIERADEIRANSTYNQRIALGLAFQLPLDPTTDPRYVAFQQDMHAQKTMEQAAGAAGEANTPEESYSDAQKLLS